MTEALAAVGVPGILAYLLVREVLGFISKRRNGRNGCPVGIRREHADLLARHDQALADSRKDFKNIDRRLERIEDHLLKMG